MAPLEDHPTRRGRIHQRHRVADAPKAHALDHRRLVPVEADRALAERDRYFLCLAVFCTRLFRHRDLLFRLQPEGSSSLPRRRRMEPGSLRSFNPANVARTTLWWFAEPSDFVMTF